MAWLDCTVTAEYDGGDHTIVVAAVQELSAHPSARPLLYYQGRYATLVVEQGPPNDPDR